MSAFFKGEEDLFPCRSEGWPGASQRSVISDPLSLSLATIPLSGDTTLDPEMPSPSSQLSEQGFLNYQSNHFTEVVSPTSPDFQEICLLQEKRFARASAGGSAYLETVDIDPQHTIPLAVRRNTGFLVGVALLELPPCTNIEHMVQFQPGSASAAILAAGSYAEIRGLAIRFGLDWRESLDALDTLGSALAQIARQREIAWLWTLPRYSVMSVLLAEIPGTLPAYRFTLSTDVLGWKEDSTQLQKMRKLRLKELPISPGTLPIIYQITPATLAEDLAQRLSLAEQRRLLPDLSARFQTAMRQASRQVHIQIDALKKQGHQVETTNTQIQERFMKVFKSRTKTRPLPERMLSDTLTTPEAAVMEIEHMRTTDSTRQKTPSKGADEKGFLPGAGVERKADYLRQFVEQGGADAQRYKALSYDLLRLERGMQVLDVGCGVGLDLLPLAERVGPDGLVIGVDHNPALVQKAIEASASYPNVRVSVGAAEILPFAHRSFDGVRADRVLQHIKQPGDVLAEMWRVLRPGGVLTLVEPDWKMVGLFPGSPAGGNDDHIWEAVLAYQQREITQPLIGRQLSNLLHWSGQPPWESVEVRAEAFALTSWPSANAVLRIAEMAQQLAEEQPSLADEITAWLKEMEAAAQRGAFLASMQLFYAYARKAVSVSN